MVDEMSGLHLDNIGRAWMTTFKRKWRDIHFASNVDLVRRSLIEARDAQRRMFPRVA